MDHSLASLPAQTRATGRGSAVFWLCCAEGDQTVLLKHLRAAGVRQAGRAKVKRSVYYDTGRRKLLRAGYRLSVRAEGRRRFQDIEVSDGSVHSIAISDGATDGVPSRAALAGTPLEGILGERAAGKLKPVFAVDIQRRSGIVDRADSSIAASFDTGAIAGDGVFAPICELRLELVSGAPDGLFDCARELGSAVPLTLTLRPLGERGFLLLPGRTDRAMGGRLVELRDAMTAREAADAVCRSCAAALLDSVAQLSLGGGRDALHRTRIGLRRLRALLWFLKSVLGAQVAILSGRLRQLAQFLGGARELDVFCDQLLAPLRRDNPDAPGIEALFETFDRRRQEAHEKVLAFVRSPAMLDFSLDIVDGLAALSSSGPFANESPQFRDRDVAAFARDRLHSRLRAFLKKSRYLRHCAPDRQHGIRVRAKKLRYAAEAFEPVIGAKHGREMTAWLVQLQDLLGELNDARVNHAIALAYAREKAGEGDREAALFAAGLAAAACSFDPTATLDRAAEARDELASLAR
jgi:triphosphatase